MATQQIDIHRELVESSKKGDVRAQFELYKLNSTAVFNTCYRIMRNREDAQDILQESFSEAFLKLPGFRHESSFRTWLKRIAVNKCINEIKRKKADLQFSDEIERYGNHAEDEGALPELSIEMVKKATEQLPTGSRLIFQLYTLEGYDHREIAEILNVSESNSKSQYMRARMKIKEILKNKLYEN
ncbi:MAG: sigma-70 family RNA polymerase sigma factor [Cyclobacteriaceae bacterium]|nr:sigma-70 family RNA polymerase sigma factor [Cyclobacteriaceae bacterium]